MSDYLCKDLQSLILKWMPVKTLLKWRCVCKSWKQLIDSTPFISDHLSLQRSRIIVQSDPQYLVVDSQTLPLYDIRVCQGIIQIQNDSDFKYLVCSVAGVICLHDYSDDLFLWNPSINKLLSIPLPQTYRETPSSQHIRMYCGFWIDPSNNFFKLVLFGFGQVTGIATGFLFSSANWEWCDAIDKLRQVDFKDLIRGLCNDSPQVLIGGVAYWSAYEYMGNELRNGVIVYFDFVQDKFGKIELPKLPVESLYELKVCKWKNLLSFVTGRLRYNGAHTCDLWVMQNESWSKMSTFNLIEDVLDVLFVAGDWGRFFVLNYKGLAVYDPKDEHIPVSVEWEKQGFMSFFFSDFVESLVFPSKNCTSSA